MAAPKPTQGNIVSFANTPQAKDDILTGLGTEDTGDIIYLDVMANDLGGKGKSLWSFDDGISTGGNRPDDLLTQDAIGSSFLGAQMWITADGKIAYQLTAALRASLQSLPVGQSATDTFTYAIQMGNGTISWAQASVVITGTNDIPVVQSVSIAAVEDGPTVSGSFIGDDIDSDDDAGSLLYSLTLQPSTGSLTDNGNGTFTYDAGSNFQELAVGETQTLGFTYTATDKHGAVSAPADGTITVTGINDAPTLQAGSASAVEDGAAVTVDLSALGNDIDSDDNGSSLTYTLKNAPPAGSVAITGTTLSFNPGTDFQALAAGETQTFNLAVEAKDKHGATVANTVAITVTGINDAPVVQTVDTFAFEDGPAVTAAFNGDDVDSDDDGGSLTYTISSQPAVGTVSNNGNGTFTYDPGKNFQGLAKGEAQDINFTYTATDQHSAVSTPATIKIKVGGTNDAPVISGGDAIGAVTAVPGSAPFKVEQFTGYGGPFDDASLHNWANTHTANYTVSTSIIDYTDDPAGFSGEIPGSMRWPADPTGASGTGGINNSFFARITGQVNVTTADTYTFRTFNDDGVYLRVNNQLIINDPTQHPENAYTGSITLAPGVYPIELFFFENGGEASLEFTYKNSSGVYGHVTSGTLTDSGVVQFSDVDLTDAHTVTVAPTGTPLGTLTAALTKDSTGSGTGGQVTWNYKVDNSAVASLGAGATKVETFNVTVNDGKGGTALQAVSVTINGANDLPVANADTAVTNEDAPVTITVLANDTDVDTGDTKALVSASNGTNGTVTLAGGNVVYTPNANYNGTDSFSYTMKDAAGGTSTASVTVTVNPVNDGPAINFLQTVIVNGSFEDSTTGWTASQINHVGDWQANDGTKILDMNAESGGGFVEQSLQTVAGRIYTVNFALSKNPGSPAGTETLRVSAAGASQDYIFNTSNSTGDMKWSQQSLTFTATGPTTVLRLAGTDPAGGDAWGPALDNVRLAAQLSAYEDKPTTIKGLSISDIDAGATPIKLDLKVSNGSLSIAGSGLSGDLNGSDGTLSINGSLADINAALVNGLVYLSKPDYNGADSLSVTVNDQGATGLGGAASASQSISIHVVPVADTYTLSNLVTNGSFENGTIGWTASQINHVGDWQANDGTKILDMNAESGGGYVEQSLQTIVGMQYTVGFALSKNPGSPAGTETLRVSAAGTSQDYVFNTVNSTADMKWSKHTLTFTATTNATTLRLAGTDPAGGDAWGPALDEVVAVTNRVITNFDKGLGDKLDLNSFLTSINAPHDNTAFSGGFLNFQASGSNTLIRIDADGGGNNYLTVATLVGVLLTTSDTGNFML